MEEVKCYLYWIRTEEMTDIFTQGYVGISTTPNVRILQHVSNARTDSHHKYPESFRDCLLSGEYLFQIMLCSSVEYCLEVERKLRPKLYVGWNRAVGGEGAVVYKHGLTGSKLAKTYYNLRTRAKVDNKDFEPRWLGEKGLETFKVFFDSLLDIEGEFTLKDSSKDYTMDNIVKVTRSEVCKQRNRTLDGVNYYSISELAEIYNLKPNTISSSLRNGWTLREAVGLDSRPKPQVLDNHGNPVVYYGKLTQSDFDFIKESLQKGLLVRQIANALKISESNLSRLIDKMVYSRGIIKIETFLGNEIILPNSTTNLEDYKKVKKLLLEGRTMSSIAKELNVSPSTMSNICKNLEWNGVSYD